MKRNLKINGYFEVPDHVGRKISHVLRVLANYLDENNHDKNFDDGKIKIRFQNYHIQEKLI